MFRTKLSTRFLIMGSHVRAGKSIGAAIDVVFEVGSRDWHRAHAYAVEAGLKSPDATASQIISLMVISAEKDGQ